MGSGGAPGEGALGATTRRHRRGLVCTRLVVRWRAIRSCVATGGPFADHSAGVARTPALLQLRLSDTCRGIIQRGE